MQSINRAHRLTSERDVNLYAIICDQSADRVLEDIVTEKINSSELAIDGRLLGEVTDGKSIGELLREALKDFRSAQDCPNETTLAATWPTLREQIREAAQCGRGVPPLHRPARLEPPAEAPKVQAPKATPVDLLTFVFPTAHPSQAPVPLVPSTPLYLPAWRRFRVAA